MDIRVKFIICSVILLALTGCGYNKLNTELAEKTTEVSKTEEIEKTTEGISSDDKIKDTEENTESSETLNDTTEQITNTIEDGSSDNYYDGSYEIDWGGADTAEEALDLFWKSISDEDSNIAKQLSWSYYIRFRKTGREMLVEPTWYEYLNIWHYKEDYCAAINIHVDAYKSASLSPEIYIENKRVMEQETLQAMQNNINNDFGANVYIQGAYLYKYKIPEKDDYKRGVYVLIIKADYKWYVITEDSYHCYDITQFTNGGESEQYLFYEYNMLEETEQITDNYDGNYKCTQIEEDGVLYDEISINHAYGGDGPVLKVKGNDCSINEDHFDISIEGDMVIIVAADGTFNGIYDKDKKAIIIDIDGVVYTFTKQ